MKPKRAGKLTWWDGLGVVVFLLLAIGIPQKSASTAPLPDVTRSTIQVEVDP